ncbi:hypothetical protein [Streptomyces sp. NPDC015131]|uniref:hypothetical protein n=1 Tax=Streptomyces sp. NPDC015131 TaxID=3364941 RepID=UPI0037024D2C
MSPHWITPPHTLNGYVSEPGYGTGPGPAHGPGRHRRTTGGFSDTPIFAGLVADRGLPMVPRVEPGVIALVWEEHLGYLPAGATGWGAGPPP